MLEPFLDPAIYALRSTIAFGDVSFSFLEKQEQTCVTALNVIRTAVQKPAVLPSLESEWRRGSVAPSVLLSILEPHMQLPPEIDLCKSPVSKSIEHEAATAASHASLILHGGASSKSNNQDEVDASDTNAKMDIFEDVSLLFAPPELQTIVLANVSSSPNEHILDSNHKDAKSELIHVDKNYVGWLQNGLVLDCGFVAEYLNLQADYFQLVNHRDCELRASEFQRLALDLHSESEIAVEGHDAAIDALLLAAECYVNPFFMMSFRSSPKLIPINIGDNKKVKNDEISELQNASEKNSCDLETVAFLEKKRDKIVLQLLLEAAELDRKFQRTSDYYPEGIAEQVVKLSPLDVQSTDAITLVRQNQALLCSFLIQRLKKEQHSMHEILMHCLVFLLHSATQLYCAPEEVIDFILEAAEHLNGMLTSFYYQLKEGNLRLDPEKIHGVQRRWMLLQRLVIASSGGEGSDFVVNINNGFRCGNLISPSAWMQRISSFSCSASPLVRFLGWMAISRNAKQFITERLFLASDLSQLTHLLSIFADELAVIDNVIDQKYEDEKIEQSGIKQDMPFPKRSEAAEQNGDRSFDVIYPDLSKFFPNLRKHFESFGENILEAVGLQLRSLSSNVVPDILCWFSDLCSWPFFQKSQITTQNSYAHLKGYVGKNAKAIILYILEAIVIEHMEAMVPEIPRVVQVLVSLCRASYCDVSFLDSIMHLLKPIISYSLCKELFLDIRQKNESPDVTVGKDYSRALTIFILASVFGDLSVQRRREILQSLTLWADFAAFEPTTSFHDYLCAFQTVLESCKVLLVKASRAFGILQLQWPHVSDSSTGTACDSSTEMHSWFLSDVFHSSSPPKISEELKSDIFYDIASKQKDCNLPVEEIEDFSNDLEDLIAKLNPTIELCWNLHHRLAKKLTITSAQCFMYSRCLSSIVPQVQNSEENDSESSYAFKPVDQFPVHWSVGLESLAEIIMKLQESHCWEVASLMLDCLLGVPCCFPLDSVINSICLVIKNFSCCAPKISWRLRSDKWLSTLFARGFHSLHDSDGPLADLFVTLLGHPEPEQRFVVLQHLGRLVGQDMRGEAVLQSNTTSYSLLSPGLVLSVPESFLSLVVSSTWDQVVLLASSDTLLPLKTRAMALLVAYIPYAGRQQLQSFLAAADSVLHVLGKITYPTCEGPLLRLSLALIACACLYSPPEDISLISQDIWRNIETIGLSRTGKLGDLEKNACEVLCRLRNEGDEAKEVLANLTSVQSCFDMFSKKIDQEAMALEEAEIELDILQKGHEVQESSKDFNEERHIPWITASVNDDNRLQGIKDRIRSLEKSKLQEDIVARRQKKLLMRRARQKYLEEAALQEEELLRELDREKAAEAEKEIERQRLLELERAKTRELRYNLDMEKERQTQARPFLSLKGSMSIGIYNVFPVRVYMRELQRELEQAESGLRSSRRDFPSSTHSRIHPKAYSMLECKSGLLGSDLKAIAEFALERSIRRTS
ncbi:unnamed protein product [Dovyalis caffra]|uniref:Uncharacterized protein n=1 Tax=Dovyalis caffra TaxID=77055 RepID=A0AAV1S156_9ROSI|nr:unnamed protein product [Dovyalis caffra]